MVTKTSPAGVSFIGSGEGFVSRTYRDQGGVLTIGYGFTNGSGVFRSYWQAKHGHALQMGDTIDRAESDLILGLLIEREYAPSVIARFGEGLAQNVFDACVSACYNAGAAILKDAWSKHVPGNLSEAARLLRSTRVTAKGKPSQGLRNRRAKEATLLQYGTYGATSHGNVDVTTYQGQLARLGFYKGAIDGAAGPATKTAVAAFQRNNPPLVIDGIAGPATKVALARAVSALTTKQAGVATAGIAAAATVVAPVVYGGHEPWMIVAGIVALAVIGVVTWSIARKHKG